MANFLIFYIYKGKPQTGIEYYSSSVSQSNTEDRKHYGTRKLRQDFLVNW